MTLPPGMVYMATQPNPFPDLPRPTPEEEARIDALWREGTTLASKAWTAARRCWNCGEKWNDAGECPTKGCRGPGSGYPTRKLPPESPCVDCHAITRAWYVGSIREADRSADGEMIPVEWVVRCASCEKKRTDAQVTAHREALAKIANPDYADTYPFDANVLDHA